MENAAARVPQQAEVIANTTSLKSIKKAALGGGARTRGALIEYEI